MEIDLKERVIDQLFEEVILILDPMTKLRIALPVVGVACKHRTCFDYETFI